jgi:hypothetical protein
VPLTASAADDEAPTTLRRRRRGYQIHSDESDLTDCVSDAEPSYLPPAYSDLSPILESPPPPPAEFRPCAIEAASDAPISYASPAAWIAASLLPRYVDQVSVASSKTAVESMLDAFTPYEELRQAEEADAEEDFARVLDRLRVEWYGVGASLIALAG